MHKIVIVFLILRDAATRYKGLIVRLLAAFLGALVVGTVAFYFIEGPQQGGVGFIEWFWSTFFTMISGDFVEVKPVTAAGKVLVTILIFFGIGFVSIVTASIASALVVEKLEAGRGMKKLHLRDHVVICGWNSGGATILEELSAVVNGRDLVVVADMDEEPWAGRTGGREVHFVRGDCTDEEVLERANAGRAHTAIVLADTSGGRSYDDADARTILAVLTVETMNRDVYTCAELVNHKNRVHLERVHVDEVVVSGEYGGKILAHSAVYHGMSQVLSDLLTGDEGSEFYRVPVPAEVRGKDFEAALDYFRREHRSIVIAVMRGDKALVNPEVGFALEDGDELAIIALDDPEIK
ncbi:MAG: NAD-binding protein [Candidatus Zixiibacteriota bacterium]